jgi:mono/diheme cytochrome c family protein
MEGRMTHSDLVTGLIAAGLIMAGAGAAVASGAAGSGHASTGITLELGQRDFRTYCAACHGLSAKGDGTLGEFLNLPIPDLTRLSKLNTGMFPAERVTQVIDGRTEVKAHGLRDMPVWGDWFNEEAASPETGSSTRDLIVEDRIRSLVGYIESIQEK